MSGPPAERRERAEQQEGPGRGYGRPRFETRSQREWRPGQTRPPRSVKVMFASSVLCLEAVLMFFYALATWGLYQNTDYAWWLFGGCLVIAALLVITCAFLRRPGGFVMGWVLQFWIIAGGIVDPFNFMYAVGVIFLACWWYAVAKGSRLDREKMERYRIEQQLAAEEGDGGAGLNRSTGPAAAERTEEKTVEDAPSVDTEREENR